ncbi:hypothetical protein RND81_09G258100 [Saponaria officinalis]|uniref:Neprosin PEP catalytic domain-containing protein n=1 Tax=Saponaria officinalis TaxID=3572 RepID=A0AAW1IQJ6_SAPOF
MTRFIFLALFSIFLLAFNGVHGRTLAHRPGFAHTTHGGRTYNCVNYYEQPAFSHPSLKHLVPKERQNSTISKKVKFNEKDGCPSGTVPIASSTGEPLVPNVVPAQVHCYAVVRTKLEESKKQFFGTNALESLNKPEATGYQWSTSRFKLWDGPETVMAGWSVFPDYYKDNEAHLFVLYTNNRSQCFNTDCAGFVQVSSHIPLGTKPDRYSEIGGPQFFWNISIELDKSNGNWNLYMINAALGKEEIGYWPGDLFQLLKTAAAQVEWGGEINNPGTFNPAPYMGSGEMAGENEKYAAFFSKITVIDENSHNVEPQDTEEFNDCHDLYFIRDKGDQGGDEGRIIYYGGRQT